MRNKLLIAVALLGSGLSACSARSAYIAVGPPPPPRYAVLGAAPGPRHIWTDGYWDWRAGRWHWVDGRWAVPPRPRAVWVPGHWDRHGRGYHFRPGYWR